MKKNESAFSPDSFVLLYKNFCALSPTTTTQIVFDSQEDVTKYFTGLKEMNLVRKFAIEVESDLIEVKYTLSKTNDEYYVKILKVSKFIGFPELKK